MTSEDIKKYDASFMGTEFWLQEIAVQLAVMNERNTPMEWAEALALSDAVSVSLRDREKKHA